VRLISNRSHVGETEAKQGRRPLRDGPKGEGTKGRPTFTGRMAGVRNPREKCNNPMGFVFVFMRFAVKGKAHLHGRDGKSGLGV